MIPTTKYIISFSLIIFSLLQDIPLVAQTYAETLQFANNQYANKNYDIALKVYKRLLFFNKEKNKLDLYEKIGGIALSKENYEVAQFNYGLAANNTEFDSLKIDFLFKKAFSEILNKKYNFAIIDLFSINDTSYNVIFKQNFYLGTCYFGLEKFNESELYFKNCIDSNSFVLLNELFMDKNLYYPSPKRAKILSILFPGLGQFYIKNYKDGFNSFLLSVGLFSLGVYNSIHVDPIYGIVTTLPWIQRYHEGGYIRAEKLAQKKRQNNRNKIYNKIVDLIQHNRKY